jgi:hypothetical protein
LLKRNGSVNDFAKVTADRRTVVVDLSEALDPSQLDLRVVRDGLRIVLEPVAAGDGARPIPPGSYTPETLPPLSEGAKAIIASIDSVAPFVDVPEGAESLEEEPFTLEDEGLDSLDLSDEGLPGLDPDR